MDILNYNEYINERGKHPCRCFCEYDVRYIIEKMDVTDNFCLLNFLPERLHIYTCKVRRDNEYTYFYIDNVYETFQHNLDDILKCSDYSQISFNQFNQLYYFDGSNYKYDEYYEKFASTNKLNYSLSEIVDMIPYITDYNQIFIKGKYSGFNPLMYAIQERTNALVYTVPEYNENEVSSYKRGSKIKIDFPTIVNELVNVNVKSGLLQLNEIIYVPLCDETLDSLFFKDLKWRDIIPNCESDSYAVYIGNITTKLLKITLQVDVFRNVFLYVCDVLNGKVWKNVLVQNVQEGNKNLVEEKITIEYRETNEFKNSDVETPNTILQSSAENTFQRIFVIDSNVFLDKPNILDLINKNDCVCVPAAVIDELNYKKDNHKDEQVRKHARWAIKNINNNDNVELKSTSPKIPKGWDYNMKDNDNKIILVAYNLLNRNSVLITSDEGMILKAKEKHIPFIRLSDFLKCVN